MTPVLVPHDVGCRYARLENGGHSDEAKRLSDTYNLHRAAQGFTARGVFAVALADAVSDGVLYPTLAECVRHQHHNEHRYAFIRLNAPSMSVCAAESVLRMHRQAAALKLADRDDKRGGLELVPRLGVEDVEHQLAALSGALAMPIALGHGKE